MSHLFTRPLVILGTLVLTTSAVVAGESKEIKIARAVSAAPAAISANARVQDVDGKTLREGDNGWTCMPGIGPGDDHPMCNDETWNELMQAVGAKKPFATDRVGLSYMLQGDAHVSNSDPYATDPNNGDVWVQEGPHLMIIVPKDLLKGLSDNPRNGGPYVMWKDNPYAHIMVPAVLTK